MPSNDETCFICHEGGNSQLGPVRSVCECRWLCVHRVCLSRWQLAKAGSGQERNCRFCSARLPDWKEAHVGQPIAAPIMSVVYDGVIHQLRVSGGEEGKACFEANIRRIFGLGPDEELSLTFGCKVPGDDAQELTLEGWGSFDAVRCCNFIVAKIVLLSLTYSVSAGGPFVGRPSTVPP